MDIETFHRKIEKKISRIGADAEHRKKIAFIVKSCRLKPFSILMDGLDKYWFDEYGNSFNAVQITFDDERLKSHTIISTDLFYGRSMRETAKESKLALFLIGNEPAIVFYGRDEYFRSFVMRDGKWKRVSALTFGLDMITMLFDNLNVGLMKEFLPVGEMHPSVSFDRCILTHWPTRQDISSCLNVEIRKAVGL